MLLSLIKIPILSLTTIPNWVIGCLESTESDFPVARKSDKTSLLQSRNSESISCKEL